MKATPNELVMILDYSSSMQRLRQTVVDSHNTFLADQQAEGDDLRFSRVWFNERVWADADNGMPIAQAKPLNLETYAPAGWTALLDALGLTIKACENDRNVIVVVITDGMENSSQRFDRMQLAEMIEHCESKLGWTFIFLAAGLDVMRQSRGFGIKSKSAFNMGTSQRAHKEGMDLLSLKMGRFRKGGHKQDLEFTEDERRQADERQWMDD